MLKYISKGRTCEGGCGFSLSFSAFSGLILAGVVSVGSGLGGLDFLGFALTHCIISILSRLQLSRTSSCTISAGGVRICESYQIKKVDRRWP